MALVTLSLGSNIEPAANVRQAVKALRERHGEVRVSPVYESEAVGFSGANFLNLVVALEVSGGLEELARELKELEQLQGRDRSAGSFAARTLDVDILTYDALQGDFGGIQLPRPEITRYAFVLQPLADLLPDARHPVLDKSYRQLWQEFRDNAAQEQRLWQVPFDWDLSTGPRSPDGERMIP
ncbi:MAG: 2-amino-4-hydroxy-6-hydroxymethyldihydropteridine diphosphokinase [Gammaproteobacteria bacterium]|nr:2-amino-4-hydroxy-6-hydroxymethyldihydropteridine diphosphokinase [Pseudomonadales bacterium]MCP5347125.1 2-amino-4-hydroxy-6-hydroxymethyldihydropteridine diphosphokinase [Pseudomonadales bacterium]